MSKLARTRGHNYEREIVAAFKPIFPNAKRHLEYQVEEANGYDLDNTGVFLIQCKRGRKYVNPNRIFEVKPQPGKVPMLATRADGMPSIVCLLLDDFLKLISDKEVGNVVDATGVKTNG